MSFSTNKRRREYCSRRKRNQKKSNETKLKEKKRKEKKRKLQAEIEEERIE